MDTQKIQNSHSKNYFLIDVLKNNNILFDEYDNMINLKFIGNGRNSNVYEIINTNKVLKITRSIDEYISAKDLIHIFNEDDSIKHYFEIPILIAPLNYKEMKNYILLNRLQELNNDERKVFDEITNFFSCENIEDIYDYVDGAETLNKYEEELYQYLLSVVTDISVYNLYIKNLMKFVFKVYEYCFSYEFIDLHVDNVMKDLKGNYKIIDAQF